MTTQNIIETSVLLENAWENFTEFFDKRYLNYSNGNSSSNWWVCWKEMDVMGHLMRFLFEEFELKKIEDMEIHLNCTLKPKNYKYNLDFYHNCKKLMFDMKRIRKGESHTIDGRSIEVDMVIAKNDREPFELCLEAKHFHYNNNLDKIIETDIKRLLAYKKFNIAKSTAFVVLDDYFKPNYVEEKIKDILQGNDEIQILYHHAPSK